MKAFLLLILSLSLFSSSIGAQNQKFQQSDSQPSNECTSVSILKELEIIRGIQEDAQKERNRIKNKMEEREAELKEDSKENLSNEYGAILQVENNTRPRWESDGWNLFGLTTMALAIFSLIIAGITFWAQWRTEKNTSKLSREEQKALLSDMIRHFYRNYVVSLTLHVKLEAGRKSKTKDEKSKNYAGYPSEEHIKKMMVNLQDVHLNLFYKENDLHHQMNKLYVMLRNYNIELDVICDHLKSQTIDYATKSRDLETLAFKCYNITKEITTLIGSIWYNNGISYVPQARERILKEQEKNRNDNTDETKHYSGRVNLDVPVESYYLKTLFADDPKLFLENLKKDVQIEAGLNTSGSPKIHIIKFRQ